MTIPTPRTPQSTPTPLTKEPDMTATASIAGQITLADLQAAFARLHEQPDQMPLPAGYRMNQTTWERLCKQGAFLPIPSSGGLVQNLPLALAAFVGVNIEIDDSLADGLCLPVPREPRLQPPALRSLEEIRQANLRMAVAGYKRDIRAGKLVYGDRATGRTTAILEVIHEDYAGMARLGLPTPTLRDMARTQYRAAYPDDVVPDMFVISKTALRGVARDKPVYVDIYDRVSGDIQIEFEHCLGKAPAGAW